MIGIATAQRFLGLSFSPATWYLARASGITLYLTLWLATVAGLGLSTHFFDLRVPRGIVFSIHTYSSALSFAFLVIHLLSLATDAYTRYSLADLLIPFHIGGHEPWIAFGIIAMDIFLVVSAASPLRGLTGYPFWRFTHWLTLPLMALAFVHGIGAGADALALPVFSMYVATALIVVSMLALRIVAGKRKPVLLTPACRAQFDRMAHRQR